jgi:hypothetical protein
MPCGGIACGIGGGAACCSSGESTADSPSTPFESAGSGAFKQAYAMSVNSKVGLTTSPAYLDEVLAFRLGDKWLELWRREGVDETSLRDDEEEHLSAG